MGVDTKISLPANVRVDDVAKIIGIAAGLKPEWDGVKDTKWIKVPGVKVYTTSIPEIVNIDLIGKMVDGKSNHFVSYLFEGEDGYRTLFPRSTAFWIAIAHRLVKFFGGKIDYQDCGDIEIDYELPGFSSSQNCPSDGEDWDVFQERMFAVKPITEEELQYLDPLAAYKLDELRDK